MKPFVVMRAHNDIPVIAETLAKLKAQDLPHELLVLDNDSTDGTLEEVKKYTDRILRVPAGTYVPGQVLNRGMEHSQGEEVVFLNSDCAPQHADWLRIFLEKFRQSRAAAAFCRQIARPQHHLLFQKDTDDTFGDGSKQQRWRQCFSMAASAVRRSAWEGCRFDEAIQYSEEIEWTWRLRGAGHQILYIPDAVVMHSHNYTLRQWYKRQRGEGKAEASIFEWSAWQKSLIRYSLLPYGRQVVHDALYCFRRGRPDAALYSPVLRMAQMIGRRRGFLSGLKKG